MLVTALRHLLVMQKLLVLKLLMQKLMVQMLLMQKLMAQMLWVQALLRVLSRVTFNNAF